MATFRAIPNGLDTDFYVAVSVNCEPVLENDGVRLSDLVLVWSDDSTPESNHSASTSTSDHIAAAASPQHDTSFEETAGDSPGDSDPPSPFPVPSSSQPPQGPPAKKRRQDDTFALLEGLLSHFKAAEENRERRHRERMAAEERRHQEMCSVAQLLASALAHGAAAAADRNA